MISPSPTPASQRMVLLAIFVSALGYFVDLFDLLIFAVVRDSSLTDLGVAKADLLSTGISLTNWQMGGMVIGGLVFGVLGDKKGRLSVLFGSILLYSLANIANAWVQNIPQYAALRFVSGVGLAGELGAGITLVSELMSPTKRGYGTMLIAALGMLGAVTASLIGGSFAWRTAYLIGGGMGLSLLLLRVGVHESPIFKNRQNPHVERGNLRMLFNDAGRFWRFIRCILTGLPSYLIIGILVYFSSAFAEAQGLPFVPQKGKPILWAYIGLSSSDILCGLLSQILRSRKWAFAIFLCLTAISAFVFLLLPAQTETGFYLRCGFLGFGVGYWATMVTFAAEQFGTNLRATVTTSVPNFIRGLQLPLTWAFTAMREPVGIVGAGVILTVVTVGVALFAVLTTPDTFGRELDFDEGALP